jgi:hypothetical protein
MRIATVVLSVVAVVLVALIAGFFVGGTLSADVRVYSVNASDEPDAFASVAGVFEAGLAPQIFQSEVIADPSEYVLIDITCSLKNRGVFAAEWVHAELSPAPGDIAVYSRSADAFDIPAGKGEALNIKVIARAGGGGTRELRLEYYVLGMKRTAKIAC